MKYICSILPASFTEQDVAWLAEAGKSAYIKMTPEAYVLEWTQGHSAFWTISGGPEGILVTSIFQWPENRELFLRCIAGVGLIRAGKGIVEDIRYMAKRAACDKIGFECSNPALLRLYQKLGGEVKAAKLFMEV